MKEGVLKHKAAQKLLSLAMSVVLVLELVPTPALAEALDEMRAEDWPVAPVLEGTPEEEPTKDRLVTPEDEGDPVDAAGDEAPSEEPLETSEEGSDQGTPEEAVSDQKGSNAEAEPTEGEGEEASQGEEELSEEERAKQNEEQALALTAQGVEIIYADAEGNPQPLGESTQITNTMTRIGGGWFVASGPISLNSRLAVEGDVSIVLRNGANLVCSKGISLSDGASLTIYREYGDESEAGKLSARTDNNHVAAITVNDGSSLVINGGDITAETYTDDAAGIGGDNGKAAGSITINGGTVSARSDMNAAAIGGGKYGNGGSITINGGTVTATANDEDGAGIGGGFAGPSGAITINGGTIVSTGATHGAGIGGGNKGDGETITITGGTVTATGGEYAAGIGAGGDSGADTIKITGGFVTAWGGKESAGIGSANKGHVNTIEITGGHVNGVGGVKGAGIGGGDGAERNGTYGTITISGEGTYVGAIGGNEAAGLGSGNEAGGGSKQNKGTITIKDAYVYAVGGTQHDLLLDDDGVIKQTVSFWPSGPNPKWTHRDAYDDLGDYGAGIGGGDLTPSGTITIENSRVTAYGAHGAAAIGSGDKAGSTGDITITNSNVGACGGGMNAGLDTIRNGAASSNGGAGIGGGNRCGGNASGNITISGGRINARAGCYAAGIGGGDDGGFGTIIIKDGADITSRGGKHGAGIGSGDVSAHSSGGITPWTTGSIQIYGADTKITAYGGDYGAAAIGGGDDGSGCNIKIMGVGYNIDGTRGKGFINAQGSDRGAGIGGGPGKAFNSIEITGSFVTAYGGYGAGIGGGGAELWDSSPSHVVGGDITITNSQISAASICGGAGIGGGIFGRANNITISGGMTDAHGGQMGGPGSLSAAVKANYACSDAIYKGGFDIANDAFIGAYGAGGGTITGGVIAATGAIAKGVSELIGLVSDTDPDIIFYIGAGIGGGYKEAGGNITIKNNAVITAVSGVLPLSLDKGGQSGHGIGWGKDYGLPKDTSITVTDYSDPGAFAMTRRVSLSDDFKPTQYDMEGPDRYYLMEGQVWWRQVVVILPYAAIETPVVVTFDGNAEDVTGEMAPQAMTKGMSMRLNYNAFTREGYDFVGWNTAADGSGIAYKDNQQVVLTDNTTLYAQWKHKSVNIKYMIDADTEWRTEIAEYGSTIELDGLQGVNGKGRILGWSETAPGQGAQTIRKQGSQIENVTRDYTWYAVFDPREPYEANPSAAVTYYPNGGTGSTVVEFADAKSTTDLTSTYKILGGNAFSRTGYTMSEWNTKANGTGTAYAFNSTPFTQANISKLYLYAQWRPNTYTVKFDANGGTGTISDQEFTYDEGQKLTSNITIEETGSTATFKISREGYRFVGWNTMAEPSQENPGTAYLDEESVKNLTTTDGGEITLYAQWLPEDDNIGYYMVMFDENAPIGTDFIPGDESGEEGDGEEAETTSGTNAAQLFKVENGQAETAPLKTRETIAEETGGFDFAPNYTFKGWNTVKTPTEEEPGVAYDDGEEIAPESNMTLYAQWAPNAVTVTFKDGDTSTTKDVPYNGTLDFAEPEGDHEGKFFVGWKEKESGKVYAAGERLNGVKEPMTFVAVWGVDVAAYTSDEGCSATVGNARVKHDGKTIQQGDNVTVSAEAQDGWTFLGWYEVTGVDAKTGLVSSYDSEKKLSDELSYTFKATESVQLVAVFKANSRANVTIAIRNAARYTVSTDPEGAVQTGETTWTVPVGQTITVTSDDASKVLQWENENGKLLGKGASLDVVVTGPMKVTLAYDTVEEKQAFVQFVTDYDQVISAAQYKATSRIAFPRASSKFGYIFKYWRVDGQEEEATLESIQAMIANGAEVITLRPLYERDVQKGSVTVKYVHGDTELESKTEEGIPYGTLKTFKADPERDGLTFKYWAEEDGTVLGYDTTFLYKIAAPERTLVAVYADADEQFEAVPKISITEMSPLDTYEQQKVSCVVTRSVPEGWELVEHGVVYGKDVDASKLTDEAFVYTDGSDGIKRFKSNDMTPTGNVRANLSVTSEDVVVSCRGFMVLRKAGSSDLVFVYSDIKSATYAELSQQ